MKPPVIYDSQTRTQLAFLQNAYDISYTQQTNAVWIASFKLPYNDYKKQYCEPRNFVAIWDVDRGGKDKYVGLFKIMSFLERDLNSIEYTLEHVMCTFIDDIVLTHAAPLVYDSGETVAEVLLDLINNRQAVARWVLDECDFTSSFVYEFDMVNLLNAIYTVVRPLPDSYYWSFNTQVYPWVLNLKEALTTTPVTDIRYKKNMFGITKEVDTRSLCTQLWIYGKEIDGARVNISSVTGGSHRIDSTTGLAEYGNIRKILIDDRFESPQNLYDYGVALLSKLDKPFVTYKIDGQTVNNAADLKIGDLVRIVTEDGLDDNLIVQEIVKNDITKSPYSGKITIGQGTVNLGLVVKSFI